MTEAAVAQGSGGQSPYRLKPDWPRRLARELLALVFGLAFLLAAGLAILDFDRRPQPVELPTGRLTCFIAPRPSR